MPPITGTETDEAIPSENGSTSSSDSDPDELAPQEVAPDTGAPPPAKRGIVRRLVRYTLVLGVLAGLVAATIYAAPIINDRIIQPVETNTADTAALQTSVDDASTRIDLLETEAAALRADLDTVNDDLTIVSDTATSNTARLDDIDTLIADQTTRLDDLDDLAATLGTELEVETSSIALEIDFLRSTELLSRARLFLYQANYGLAEQDVQAAYDLLTPLLATHGDDGPVDTATLASALSRIDLVLAALPDRPVAASDDLDIAWRLLLDEPLSPLLASTNPAGAPVDETPPTTLEN